MITVPLNGLFKGIPDVFITLNWYMVPAHMYVFSVVPGNRLRFYRIRIPMYQLTVSRKIYLPKRDHSYSFLDNFHASFVLFRQFVQLSR